MPPSAYKHFVNRPSYGLQSVVVVGAGGNGGQMLTALARLSHAMVAMGGRGLHVVCYDGDRVSRSNLARQPFYESDIGKYKAEVLIGRINALYGFSWEAKCEMLSDESEFGSHWMVIGCVDSPSGRRQIHSHVTAERNGSNYSSPVSYWLDLGNRASIGQYIVGEPKRSVARDYPLRLPTVMDLWPDLLDPSLDPQDDGPSCSMAEALERQDLFVNTVLVSHAANLIWQMIRNPVILHHGGFVNLSSGRATSLGVNVNEWKSFGYKARRPTGKRSTELAA